MGVAPPSDRSGDASPTARGGRRAVLVLALVAAFALVAAELTTIATVDVPDESCEVVYDREPELADRCALSGWERHGGALLLLALLVAAAGAAAGRTDRRLTGAALIGAGAIALGIALIGDLPETNATGAIGLDFEGATAAAGLGFYLELTGSVLAILAGILTLSPTDPE